MLTKRTILIITLSLILLTGLASARLEIGNRAVILGTTKIVSPGTNTLSTEIASMSNGDAIVLAAGDYIQTVSIVIPDNVIRFSIIGHGVGVSNIIFNSDVDGIKQFDYSDRLTHVTLEHFSLIMNVPSSTRTGIYLYGSSSNDRLASTTKNYTIRNVDIRGTGAGKFWSVGIKLEDAYNFLIGQYTFDGDGYPNGAKALVFLGCVNGNVIGGQFNWCGTGAVLDIVQHYRGYDGQHGCAGINFNGVTFLGLQNGIIIGNEIELTKITNCIFDYMVDTAIVDTSTVGSDLVGCTITGNWFNGHFTAFPLSNYLIKLKSKRNIITNNNFYLTGQGANGIRLGDISSNRSSNNNIISNNQFKGMDYAIYIDIGDRNSITGNNCDGGNGPYNIFINQGDYNNLVGNIVPRGLTFGLHAGAINNF